MNRLISIRHRISHPHLGPKTAAASLRKYTTVRAVSSTPISTPLGRGYGVPMRGRQNMLQRTLLPLGKVSQNFMNARHFAEIKAENQNSLLKSLEQLVDEEINSINEFEKESIYGELGEEFLSRSGMKFLDSSEEGKIMLVGTKGNATFKISFNRLADEVREEEQEGEEEEEEAEEEEEYEDEEETPEDEIGQHVSTLDQLPETKSLPQKQNLDIEITYASPDGKPKGQLLIEGFAGKDRRLYIDMMSVQKERGEHQPSMEFADLSDDMQDVIYQYLEQFHIDDSLAQFVQQQVARERSNEDIDFLTEFKSLIV